MTLSLAVRKKRNEQVTKMLKEKCNIKVVVALRDDEIENANWFTPIKRGSGELILKVRK